MKQPLNVAFYMVVSMILTTIFIFVAFALFIVQRGRKSFEHNAKKYIGRSYWETRHDLRLKKREKIFYLSIYFMGATYRELNAGRTGYTAQCYYNGKKCVCFLYDNLFESENPVIDCYTTTPLRKDFDGAYLKGHPYTELYERFGRPAVDGLFDSLVSTDQYRRIIYLLRTELYLSKYVYVFFVNDEGIIDKIKLGWLNDDGDVL